MEPGLERVEPSLKRAVVALDDDAACDPARVGGKAAALARAARSGLNVLPGFAIAAGATSGGPLDPLIPDLVPRWKSLSDDGRLPLVVRSSSVVEDTSSSSMAGRFRSVVGVRSWNEFLAAVRAVLDSAAVGGGDGGGSEQAAMGVLVQRQIKPTTSGVLFGIDPVTGREDRLVVAVVSGEPGRLVGGEVEGARYELDPRGAVVNHQPGEGGARLSRRQRRALVHLAERAAAVFGGPQDVEWASDERGALVLLQSRPVTTPRRGEPYGTVLGPGPVAETFPGPLSPLEEDLWVDPLREGIRQALTIAGAVPAAAIAASPVAVVVGGRVAVDLELMEGRPGPRSGLAALDPRPSLRRLRAAARTGRLRQALPSLARQVVDRADDELCRVPPLTELHDAQLLALLDRCRQALVSLHGYEMLSGVLLGDTGRPVTGAGVAMAVLAEARRQGRPDTDVVAETPVVLALVPPAVGRAPELPSDLPENRAVTDDGATAEASPSEGALLREALRLRVRWVQELSARAAWELAVRLVRKEVLADPADVRCLRWPALRAAITEGRRPEPEAPRPVEEPLPARFRLGTRGRPIPVSARQQEAAGAGGGCGVGPAHHGPDPPAGSVLVVAQLEPGLAPVLSRLGGLVAETGSVLAHAAILAREAGVPTVVGVADARKRFPPGTRLRVDGDGGEVTVLDDSPR